MTDGGNYYAPEPDSHDLGPLQGCTCGPCALAHGLTQDHRPWTVEERKAAVLQVLGDRRMTARQIERELGWHPSTAPSVLTALAEKKYVVRQSDGRWRKTTMQDWLRRRFEQPWTTATFPEYMSRFIEKEEVTTMGFLDDFDGDFGDEPLPTGYSNRTGGTHPLNDLTLIGPFLAQGEKWCSANGAYIEIARMGRNHAAATVNFLLRRAQDIAMVHFLSQPVLHPHEGITGASKVNDPTNYRDTYKSDDARAWLLRQPLVRALVARAQDASAVEQRFPWQREQA